MEVETGWRAARWSVEHNHVVPTVRVATLTYSLRLLHPGHWIAEDASPWEGDLGTFACSLESFILTARPRKVFHTIGAAQRALAPRLRAWELWADLQRLTPMEFVFLKALVTDDCGQSREVASRRGTVGAHDWGMLRAYPEPPDPRFEAHPVGLDLWVRVRKMFYGEAEDVSMAYTCLTKIKRLYGGLPAVAARLRVSREVLGKLSELVSNRNDPDRGRKMIPGAESPLSVQDLMWIHLVVTVLVRRVIEVESGMEPIQLGMTDLAKTMSGFRP